MRTLFFAISAGLLIGLNACKTAKPIAKIEKSTEIEIPFSEKKYKTDDKFLRASQSGTSPDLATSKKIAIQNAKSEMAGNIKAIIKSVTEQYIKQNNIGVTNEYKSQFQELTRSVTQQSISGTYIQAQKTFKHQADYTTWVSIELSNTELLREVSSSISKQELNALEFDKGKFEMIFNKELSQHD